MGTQIKLTAADGHNLSAYHAKPGTSPSGALVVIQEIFGVNSHIRSVCDNFADAGYEVLSPALFDRVERNIELGYSDEDVSRGRDIRARAGWDEAVLDVAAVIDVIDDAARIGVVGYCWGGSVAWLTATRLKPSAAVCYYGGQIVDFRNEQPDCPVMMHFGEHDSAIPMTDVDTVKSSQPEADVHIWPAGHGFNCDSRSSFDADSATKARELTLGFLRANLAS